jgi:PPOX class probable F420-dependent enzyme
MNQLSPQKQAVINKFLQQPLIARMATADMNGQPHVVPVWFGWDGTTLWISSYSNTRKVGELERNPKISVVMDIAEDGGTNKGVIFEGSVELIREPREFLREKFVWIYTRYLGTEGVLAKEPQSWIEDPHNLLIKLTPDKVIGLYL